VENRSGLDYHAYDWIRIDPRLESPGATYQDLINDAHARGIKIIQDVVINHSSQYGIRDQVWTDHLPIKYYVPQGSQQGRIDNGSYRAISVTTNTPPGRTTTTPWPLPGSVNVRSAIPKAPNP